MISLVKSGLCKQYSDAEAPTSRFKTRQQHNLMRPSSSIAKLRSYDMGDSDSSPKKVGVPSWQLKSNETTTTEENAKPSEAPSGEPSREVIVEQAKKFLEDSEVKNESTDKKIAFLEGKGLTGAEIQELIGVTRNIEASSIPSSTPTAVCLSIPSPLMAF